MATLELGTRSSFSARARSQHNILILRRRECRSVVTPLCSSLETKTRPKSSTRRPALGSLLCSSSSSSSFRKLREEGRFMSVVASSSSSSSSSSSQNSAGKVGVNFVCLGNICRSPAAEAVFKTLVKDAKMEHLFDIDSCGTGGGKCMK